MLAAFQREPMNSADLIIPVPLHPNRERERGFNQAALLARELASLSKLPLDEHSGVRRVQTGLHRAAMDSRARRQSVAAPFPLRPPDAIATTLPLPIAAASPAP